MKWLSFPFWGVFYLRTLLLVTTLALLMTVQSEWEAFVFTCHANDLPFHLLPASLKAVLPSDCLQRPLIPWVFIVPFIFFYLSGMASNWWLRKRLHQFLAMLHALAGTLLTSFIFSMPLLRMNSRDQLAKFRDDDSHYILTVVLVVVAYIVSLVSALRTCRTKLSS